MNRILIVTLALFFVFSAPALAQKSPKKSKATGADNSPALLSFDNGTKVTKDEFEYVYQKNNGGWASAKKQKADEYKSYLNLYINFKRKVMEAESLKLQDKPEFIQEFEGYRKQLSQPYLVDQDLQEIMIREAFDRSQYLVKASHILFNVAHDAIPEDTLKAYNRALAIRDSILKGDRSFENLAEYYSEDPSAKKNSGNLGYFTVFDMVYPFESGAYNTAAGQVSMPVRTGFGYHLIKVYERIKTTGRKTASHIIVRVGPQYSAKDSAQAMEKIKEISTQLKAGADFAELAMRYSDDQVTARKGGDLGAGRLIPEMEEVKMRLNAGQYSDPFKSSYGWHIMKVTSEDKIKTFEESKNELKNRVARDARATLSRESLIKKVKAEFGFTQNDETIKKIIAAVDDISKFTKGFWRPDDSIHAPIYPLEVYSLGKGDDRQSGKVEDFFNFYVTYRKGIDASTAEQAVQKLLEVWYEQEILNFEEKQLPKKYRDYRELVKEYRDGILLFTITETMVWRKAVEDTNGLKTYYEEHKDSFLANERVIATEYQTDNKENMEKAKKMLESGASNEAIDRDLNASSPLNFKYRQVTFEKGKNNADVDIFGKPVGYRTEIVPAGSVFRIFEVKEILPPGQRTFEQARSESITKYQNHLEQEWLKTLEKKYPVKVNDKALSKLFK